MAINWQDPNQVRRWREQAILKWPEEEVDAVIAENTPKVSMGPTTPKPQQDVKGYWDTEPDSGFLEKVAAGVVNTFTGMPRMVAELGHQVGNISKGTDVRQPPSFHELSARIDAGEITTEQAQQILDSFIEGNQENIDRWDAKYIKQNELDQISGDVGKGALLGAKKGAGTASFFVPGAGPSGTVGKAVVQGVKAGALAGFGQEQDELSLGGSLAQAGVGAVTGGVTAGILQKIGNHIRGVKANKTSSKTMTHGEKVRAGVSQPQAKASPFYAEEMADIQRVPVDVEDVTNIKIRGNPDRQLESMGAAFRNIDDNIYKQLDVSDDITYGNAFKNFDDEVAKTNWMDDKKIYDTAKKEMTKRLSKELSKGGKQSINAYKLKSELRGELGRVFKKVDAGASLTPAEEVKFALYSSLKKTVDGVSPEVSKLNSLQHGMFDYADGLVKSSKQQGIKIPWADIRWKGPANLFDDLRDSYGRALVGAGSGQRGQLTQEIMEEIPPALVSGTQAVTEYAVPKVAAQVAGKAVGQGEAIPDLDAGEDLGGMSEVPEISTEVSVTLPNGATVNRTQLFEARVKYAGNSKVQAYLDIIEDEITREEELRVGTDFVPETEGDFARLEASNAVDTALGLMYENPDIKMGMLAGPVEQIKGKFGAADPETLAFNTSISNIKHAIAKARAGTAISAKEEEMLNKYTPKIGDSAQELKIKLEALRKGYDELFAAKAGKERGISLDELSQ